VEIQSITHRTRKDHNMAEHNKRLHIFTELLEALAEHPEVLYETPVAELAAIAVRLQHIEKRKEQ